MLDRLKAPDPGRQHTLLGEYEAAAPLAFLAEDRVGVAKIQHSEAFEEAGLRESALEHRSLLIVPKRVA